jgi:SAM-dependent methyltransferase
VRRSRAANAAFAAAVLEYLEAAGFPYAARHLGVDSAIVRAVPRLWDDSLYAGSAAFYLQGRLPYPERLVDVFRERLDLDGSGRLLDLGCGPGSLTLLLAPRFREVVAVDADADMIRVGMGEAVRRGIRNVRWLHAYAEDFEDVGRFQVVTLAQSFHWMDRPVVARKIHSSLQLEGHCVYVGATTHEGTGSSGGSALPTVPWAAIRELIRGHLGPERRAGRGIVAGGYTSDEQHVVFRAAGFKGPEIVSVPGGDVFERSQDQVVASVLSLSSAAPHLFGDRLPEFTDDLRRLLRSASPSAVFSEQLQDMRLFLWRA